MNPFIHQLLYKSLHSALETYSNVHRGNGPASDITTALYEKSREIVVKHLKLNPKQHTVVFGSPWALSRLNDQMDCKAIHLKGSETGINVGVDALVGKKKLLNKTEPFLFGGGTTLLYDKEWVMYDKTPARFEAGAPPVINVIAFARALQLTKSGNLSSQPPLTTNPLQSVLQNGNNSKYSGQELLNIVRRTMIGKDTLIPTLNGPKSYLHFDNASSTPAMDEAWKVFYDALLLDKSSCKEIVEQSRQLLAKILNAPPEAYEIWFATNTTEAINIVAESLKKENHTDIEPVILSSMLEHSSNDLPWRKLENHRMLRLEVTNEGAFDISAIKTILTRYNLSKEFGNQRISLLCLNAASNITGSVSDFEEIAKLAHSFGARILIDAAQLIAHREINVQDCQIDYMVCSGHKAYAPFGSGMLITRKNLLKFNQLEELEIKDSSESNPGGIAALAISLKTLYNIGFKVIESEIQLLESKIRKELSNHHQLTSFGMSPHSNSTSRHRTPVISFVHKTMMSSRIASRLARQSAIGIRYGCMCAHLFVKQLHQFTPFQTKLQKSILGILPFIRLQGVARISLGIQHTEKEADILIQTLKQSIGSIKNSRDKKSHSATVQASVSYSAFKAHYKAFQQERMQKVFASNDRSS